MYLIAIYNSLDEYRDSRINTLLNGSPIRKDYISNYNSRYYGTSNIETCKYWKNKTTPEKVVKKWLESGNRDSSKSKFSIWGNKYLVVEEITKDEWLKIKNFEINSIRNQISKLENEIILIEKSKHNI